MPIHNDNFDNDLQESLFDHIPYCFVTEHQTYISVTREYVNPIFLKGVKTKNKGISKHKVPPELRNRRIRQIGMSVQWKTFLSLTFSNENYTWADYDDLQHMYRTFVKRLYRKHPGFKYLAVLEHGGENGRIHYHMLTDIDIDSEIFINFKLKNRKICPEWKYGFSDVTKVHNRNCNAVFYLLKYLSKEDKYRTPIGKREVFSSRGLGKVTKKIVHESELGDILNGTRYYTTYEGPRGNSQIYLKKSKKM